MPVKSDKSAERRQFSKTTSEYVGGKVNEYATEITDNRPKTAVQRAVQSIANQNTKRDAPLQRKSRTESKGAIQTEPSMLANRPWNETIEQTPSPLPLNQQVQQPQAVVPQQSQAVQLQNGAPQGKSWKKRLGHNIIKFLLTPIVKTYELYTDIRDGKSNYHNLKKDLGARTSGLMIAHDMIKKIAAIVSWCALITTLLALGVQFFIPIAGVLGMIAFWAHVAQILFSGLLIGPVFKWGTKAGADAGHLKYYRRKIILDLIMGILGGLSGGLIGGGLSHMTHVEGPLLSHLSSHFTKGVSIGIGGAVGPGGKGLISGIDNTVAPKQFQTENKPDSPSATDSILSEISELQKQTHIAAVAAKQDKSQILQDKDDLSEAEKQFSDYKNNGKVDPDNLDSLISESDSALNEEPKAVELNKNQEAKLAEAKVATMEAKISYVEKQVNTDPESLKSDDKKSAVEKIQNIEVKPKKKGIILRIKEFFKKLAARLAGAKNKASKLKNRMARKSQEAFMSAIGVRPKIKATEAGIADVQKAIPAEVAERTKEQEVLENFAAKIAEFKAAAKSEKEG